MSDNSPGDDNNTPPYSPPTAPSTPDAPDYGASTPGYDTPPGAPAYDAAPQAPAYPAYNSAPGYPGGQAYAAPAPTNPLAITALIAGIAGFIILPFIGSLVAIITGHMALSKLKTSGEQGRGMALAGVIMGYVGIALGVLSLILLVALWGVFATTLSTY